MGSSEFFVLASAATGIAAILAAVALKNRHGELTAPASPTSVSILAGFSFFAGLLALVMTATAGLLAMSVSLTGMINLERPVHDGLTLAARILLYASLLPAIASVAFAMVARGIITESKGSVFGRALYRSGLCLAVLSAVAVYDARLANPATWAAIADLPVKAQGPVDRVYFGASHRCSSDSKGNLVLQVDAGSPADKAGLRVGDRILGVDNVLLGAQELMAERLSSYKPGARVTLEVRRGEESLSLAVELGSSLAQFEPLLDLLEDQSLDDERFAVLKAAGLDRRYTAEELTKICKLFDFDESRLKVINRALPHLQDPQNAFRVLATLDFSDSKEKVSGWIENAKPK